MKKILLLAICMFLSAQVWGLDIKLGHSFIDQEYSSYANIQNELQNQLGTLLFKANAVKTNANHSGLILVDQKIDINNSPYFAQITADYNKDSLLNINQSKIAANLGIMAYPDIFTKIELSVGSTYRDTDFVGNIKLTHQYSLGLVNTKSWILLEGGDSEIYFDGRIDVTSAVNVGCVYTIKNKDELRSETGSLYLGILI